MQQPVNCQAIHDRPKLLLSFVDSSRYRPSTISNRSERTSGEREIFRVAFELFDRFTPLFRKLSKKNPAKKLSNDIPNHEENYEICFHRVRKFLPILFLCVRSINITEKHRWKKCLKNNARIMKSRKRKRKMNRYSRIFTSNFFKTIRNDRRFKKKKKNFNRSPVIKIQ